MNFGEGLRIVPMFQNYGTVVATSCKIKHYGGDFAVLCQVGFQSSEVIVPYSTAADFTATKAANVVSYAVVEATAASAAGSAITGATLSLGPSTVGVIRGGVISAIEFTSDLTTVITITVNGRDYHSNTTGPGRDGENVATEMAAVFNGRGTNESIPHYEAIANPTGATGIVIFQPIDDMATGLTISGTAAVPTGVKLLPGFCQGIIKINAGKLSTTTPKYIGVTVTETTCNVPKSAHFVSYGDFQGAVVNVTTP